MTSRHTRRIGGHDLYTDDLRILADIADRPAFMDGSELCAQADPETWFPEKGGSTAKAKAICGHCPLQAACLEFALLHNERFGIWGGRSERERRALPKPPQSAPVPRKARVSAPSPTRTCPYKTRYPTEAAAVAAARRVTPDHRRPANHLGLVACSTCGGWHLTEASAA